MRLLQTSFPTDFIDSIIQDLLYVIYRYEDIRRNWNMIVLFNFFKFFFFLQLFMCFFFHASHWSRAITWPESGDKKSVLEFGCGAVDRTLPSYLPFSLPSYFQKKSVCNYYFKYSPHIPTRTVWLACTFGLFPKTSFRMS